MRRSRLSCAIHFPSRVAALCAAFFALASAASATVFPALSLAHNFAPGSLSNRTAAKFTERAVGKQRHALRIDVQRGPIGEEGEMALVDFNPRGVERALSGLARLLAGYEGERVYRQVRDLR